jgi:hypothetical protein
MGNRKFVIATWSNLGGFRDMWSQVAPMWPGGFSNDITVGFVGVNNIPLVHIFQKDMQACSTGKNRRDHEYISLVKEFSISWHSREEGDSNNDKGVEDNSIEEEKNRKEHRVSTGQATWKSHLEPEPPEITCLASHPGGSAQTR